MKIASITLFCNEHFRLEPWIQYFNEYKEDIYIQVIVNNGNSCDTELLKAKFPDAIVLYSETNNMIASYNLAIRYILEHSDADSILQVTNDLRIEKDGLKTLHKFLFENEDAGIVSPILLKKDSNRVENYGAEINLRNMDFNHICRDCEIKDIPKGFELRTGLPGGCFLTKRSVYERIGLQDERINMYTDEVDIGIKCMQNGIKLYSTSLVRSWHQHVFPAGKQTRNPKAHYYMARNPIYIARKYWGFKKVLPVFVRRFQLASIEMMSCIHHLKSKEHYMCAMASLLGCFVGLFYK